MENFKSFLKKNKRTVFVFACCFILTVIVFTIKIVFFSNNGTALYGDRLEGINEVKITTSQFKKITNSLEEKEEIEKATANLSGRILNVHITVKSDISVDTAKTFTGSIDEALDDEQKKFYDVQVFVMKNGEDDKFPIIGYRHQNNDYYSWTKDR